MVKTQEMEQWAIRSRASHWEEGSEAMYRALVRGEDMVRPGLESTSRSLPFAHAASDERKLQS